MTLPAADTSRSDSDRCRQVLPVALEIHNQLEEGNSPVLEVLADVYGYSSNTALKKDLNLFLSLHSDGTGFEAVCTSISNFLKSSKVDVDIKKAYAALVSWAIQSGLNFRTMGEIYECCPNPGAVRLWHQRYKEAGSPVSDDLYAAALARDENRQNRNHRQMAELIADLEADPKGFVDRLSEAHEVMADLPTFAASYFAYFDGLELTNQEAFDRLIDHLLVTIFESPGDIDLTETVAKLQCFSDSEIYVAPLKPMRQRNPAFHETPIKRWWANKDLVDDAV